MTRNFAAEARINQACTDAGVLESALPDFIEDFYANKFVEAELADHITQCRETKPHRFAIAGESDADLAVAAFGPHRTLTAQGAYVRQFGDAKAREVAAQFGTVLGGKPGTLPEAERVRLAAKEKADVDTGKPSNPWHPSNCDARGWFTPAAITKQTTIVKTMGLEAAARMAAKHGCRIGDVKVRRVA